MAGGEDKNKSGSLCHPAQDRVRCPATEAKFRDTKTEQFSNCFCFPLIIGTPVSPESPRCYLCPRKTLSETRVGQQR